MKRIKLSVYILESDLQEIKDYAALKGITNTESLRHAIRVRGLCRQAKRVILEGFWPWNKDKELFL